MEQHRASTAGFIPGSKSILSEFVQWIGCLRVQSKNGIGILNQTGNRGSPIHTAAESRAALAMVPNYEILRVRKMHAGFVTNQHTAGIASKPTEGPKH